MSNNDVSQCVWMTLKQKEVDLNSQGGLAVDMVMKTAMLRKSIDNVTCVFIGLKGFENNFNCR